MFGFTISRHLQYSWYGVRGIEVIGTVKESVSGPQNDQMFSKNLGHVPLTKAQPHCPLSQFFVECQDQKWDWWVSAYGGHCYGIQFSFPLTQCVLHAKHLGESLPITYSPWDETLLLSLTFSREFNLLSPLRSEHSLHDFPISCHSQWNCSLSPGRCWTFSHAALQNLLTSLLHVHLCFHSTPPKKQLFFHQK